MRESILYNDFLFRYLADKSKMIGMLVNSGYVYPSYKQGNISHIQKTDEIMDLLFLGEYYDIPVSDTPPTLAY